MSIHWINDVDTAGCINSPYDVGAVSPSLEVYPRQGKHYFYILWDIYNFGNLTLIAKIGQTSRKIINAEIF